MEAFPPLRDFDPGMRARFIKGMERLGELPIVEDKLADTIGVIYIDAAEWFAYYLPRSIALSRGEEEEWPDENLLPLREPAREGIMRVLLVTHAESCRRMLIEVPIHTRTIGVLSTGSREEN